MKKPLLLLALPLLLATCDRSPSDTGPLVDALDASVRPAPGGPAASIGAALLSVEGDVVSVTSTSVRVLTHSDAGGLTIALIADDPDSRLDFRITMERGARPTVSVLQVADGADQLFGDPAAFVADVEGD